MMTSTCLDEGMEAVGGQALKINGLLESGGLVKQSLEISGQRGRTIPPPRDLKARIFDQFLEASAREETQVSDAQNTHRLIVEFSLQQVLNNRPVTDVGNGKQDVSPRFEQTVRLEERRQGVGEMFQYVKECDAVEESDVR